MWNGNVIVLALNLLKSDDHQKAGREHVDEVGLIFLVEKYHLFLL